MALKIICKNLLLFVLGLQCCGSVEVPDAFRELIDKPSDLSEGSPEEIRSIKVEDEGVILETKEFICHIQITRGASKLDDDGSVYDSISVYNYRCYSKNFNLVVSGRGRVFEKNLEISEPIRRPKDKELVDTGSNLIINCGVFLLRWSAGDHIYFGAGTEALLGSADDYWKMIEKERVESGEKGADN